MVANWLLAREYLNDADKAAASFIELSKWTQAFASTPSSSQRMYKTGDLVFFCYNQDGLKDYLAASRKDSQVKVHGQRLELGECCISIWVSSSS